MKQNNPKLMMPLLSTKMPISTIDDVINSITLNRYHYTLLFLCGLGFCVDSMEVVLLSFVSSCAGEDFNLSDSQIASITSSVFFGSLLGSLFWGPVADKYGRRKSFIASISTILIGGWLSGLSPNFGWLVTLRFIVGFGVGGSTVPFDIFAEFLPVDIRGQYLMLVSFFWAAGGVFVVLGAKWVIPIGGWRSLVYLVATPVTVCAFMAIYLLPESPRWLVSKGRYAEAEALCMEAMKHSGQVFSFKFGPGSLDSSTSVIEKTTIYGTDNVDIDASKHRTAEAPINGNENGTVTTMEGDVYENEEAGSSDSSPTIHAVNADTPSSTDSPSKPEVEVDLAVVCAQEEADRSIWEGVVYTFVSYKEIVFSAEHRLKTAKIGVIWLVFGFTYYGVILLVTRLYETGSTNDADGGNRSSNAACEFDYGAILVNTSAEFVGLLFATLTIERWGRRGTQSSLYGIGSLALILMGVLHYHGKTPILIFGYLGRMAAMGSSCATWVVTPELYPTRVRATAHSFLNAVARLGAFASPVSILIVYDCHAMVYLTLALLALVLLTRPRK